jgi:hypothetical protein
MSLGIIRGIISFVFIFFVICMCLYFLCGMSSFLIANPVGGSSGIGNSLYSFSCALLFGIILILL